MKHYEQKLLAFPCPRRKIIADVHSSILMVLVRSTMASFVFSEANSLVAVSLEVAGVIQRFIEVLSRETNLMQVILFGSQANGNAHKWSDIDLVVISNDFEGRSKTWRKATLTRIANQAGTYSIQAVGFSSQEWCSAKPEEFAGLIRAYGLLIVDNGR